MSDTDSFIDEVTEEVRRDRLFGYMRRYGWIAVLAVFLIVGGATWNEWRKAQERSAAQSLGDEILAALQQNDRAARADDLAEIDAPNPGAQAVVDLLAASEASAESPAEAATRLLTLADREGVDLIYRQIATLKAVTIAQSELSQDERLQRLEGLAMAGGVMRLLAEEQLALIDIEAGQTDTALEKMARIVEDAQATAGLRRRATQVIVALGGEPPAVPQADAGQ